MLREGGGGVRWVGEKEGGMGEIGRKSNRERDRLTYKQERER